MGHYVIKPTKSGGAHDPRPQLWWHPWKIEYLYPLRMCCKGLLPSFLLHTWSRASDLLNPFPFVVMLISEPRLIMFFFGRSWLWSWFKDGPKDFILEPSWNYVLPSSSVLDYEARHRPYLDSSIKNYIIYFFDIASKFAICGWGLWKFIWSIVPVPDYCFIWSINQKSSSLKDDFERLMMSKEITTEVIVLFLASTRT